MTGASRPWVVPGLIPAGLSVLEGRWNEGTSSVALSVLLAVATGGRALGKIPAGEPREVLYVALRDSDRSMAAQCRDILGGEPIPERFRFMTSVKPGKIAETLTAWIEAHPGTALIIIDPLAKLTGPTGRADIPTKIIGEELRGVAEAHENIAIVPVCQRTVGGATQDAMGATATIAFDRYTAASAVIRVTGVGVPEREYPLSRDPAAGGGWTIDGSYPGPAASDFAEWTGEILGDVGYLFSAAFFADIDGNGTQGWKVNIQSDLAEDRERVKQLILNLNITTTKWFFDNYGMNLPGSM